MKISKMPVKVNAFTIMEITVSLAVAAIVIMITYTAYRIISQGYLDFNKKNEDLAVLLRLDQLLKRDFDQAELIIQTPEGMLIQKDSTNIIYNLGEDAIVRNSSIVDSFKVKVSSKSFSFEGAEVHNVSKYTDKLGIENTIPEIESSVIDQLDLSLSFKEESISYTYKKSYSSSNLILKANAIN